ncbi:hypothetical protein [Halostreptopolyspora alba]
MSDTIAVSGLAFEPRTACKGGMPTPSEIPVGRDPLTRDDVVAVARHGARARLTEEARKTTAVRDRVRERVPGPGPDRHLAPEIDAVTDLIAGGAVDSAAETRVPLP